MRARALLGAALAAVLMLAALPSVAKPKPDGRAVRIDSSSDGPEARSAAGCSAGSVPLDSVGGHLYKYCGQYWPISKLPIQIHANTSQAKPNQTAFLDALRLAVQAWDAVAPVNGTGPRPAGCANARIICLASISNGPGTAHEVDVGWAHHGGPFGYPGQAMVLGATPGPISDVGITLNWNLSWFGGGDAEKTSTGVPAGAAAGIGCVPAPALCSFRFDLGSIIAHELGHAFGLEDLNPGASCPEPGCGWPNDLEDAPDYQQVMYAFYYPGSSNKRVPREGDIAGLARVMFDSQAH